MIRDLKQEEISDAIPLAMAAAERWSEEAGMEADFYTVKAIVRMCVSRDDRCALVHDDLSGIALAMEFEWPLDLRQRQVHEMLIAGEDTDKLKKAVEDWAKGRGHRVVVESCLQAIDGSRFRRVR